MTVEELRAKWQSQPIPYLSEEEIDFLFQELNRCDCDTCRKWLCIVPCPAGERRQERIIESMGGRF
jgi:hypothetical protein